MKINELKDGMRRIDVEGIVIDLPDNIRTVGLRTGGTARVVTARITDETGEVGLTLWDHQIEQVKKGDRVKIFNGYTNSYQGTVQMNVGKYGKMEVLSSLD